VGGGGTGEEVGEVGEGEIIVYSPSEMFAKLAYKNAIKHKKTVSSPKKFHNPYIPSLPKFGKNLMDPPPGFSNHVHVCTESRYSYTSL
jgi:hypothetical protein